MLQQQQNIEPAYKELMQSLQLYPKDAGDNIAGFAKLFSTRGDVHFNALLLKDDLLKHFNDAEIRNALIEKISKLATSIYQENGKEGSTNTAESDAGKIKAFWAEKNRERQTVFTCENISKTYPRQGFKLENITLSLRAGEITGIVGENGNGKTTLLKIIAGELYPDRQQGNISYASLQGNANKIEWEKIKPQIGYLSQELNLQHELPLGSVKRSLQYAVAIRGITGTENDNHVNYIIQRLGLGKYENAKWKELSGGFKVRFALARVLIWTPKLLVLDEPLANLDVNTQVRVLNDLKDICKSIKHPISVILSSQNIEELEAASDNMIVLKNGQIQNFNPTAAIAKNIEEHLFEFRCDYTMADLKHYFKDFDYLNISSNGFSFFIATPLHIPELTFLRYCADKNIALSYFQNLTTSVKKLIIKTTTS